MPDTVLSTLTNSFIPPNNPKEQALSFAPLTDKDTEAQGSNLVIQWISGGIRDLNPDFSAHPFNHVDAYLSKMCSTKSRPEELAAKMDSEAGRRSEGNCALDGGTQQVAELCTDL